MAGRAKLCWSAEQDARAQGSSSTREDDGVTAMLGRLNLAAGEDEKVVMSDDEDGDEEPKKFSLIGKVLSPSVLHLQTIMGAMKPAWGNPRGLRARSVGDNMFIADFLTLADKERAMDGTPWLVGRHAVLLQDLKKDMRPSTLRFDSMLIWVRILDFPFKWMNKRKGTKAARLIGKVDKVDVDEYDEAAGTFFRARVEIPLEKPLKRYITLENEGVDEYYALQYEKLPFSVIHVVF
jgi:hypothetical protein